MVPIESAYCYTLVVNSNFGPHLAPFQRHGGLTVENRQFCLPHSFGLKFGGVPFGVDPSCWVLHSEMVRLISCKIAFAFPLKHGCSLHSGKKLDGQGRARREAARRRNSECKIDLSCRNSSRGNGSRPKRSGDWLTARRCDQCDTLPANHRCAVGVLPLLQEEFGLLKLILHSKLWRRAASRRALPCPSSLYSLCDYDVIMSWNRTQFRDA